MKSKFTPGPWFVASYNETETELAVTIAGYTICLLDQSYFSEPLPRKQTEANARLISAAPEMYAYLTKVESIVLRIREHLPSGAISVVEHCLTDLDAHAFDLLQKIEGTDETSK